MTLERVPFPARCYRGLGKLLHYHVEVLHSLSGGFGVRSVGVLHRLLEVWSTCKLPGYSGHFSKAPLPPLISLPPSLCLCVCRCRLCSLGTIYLDGWVKDNPQGSSSVQRVTELKLRLSGLVQAPLLTESHCHSWPFHGFFLFLKHGPWGIKLRSSCVQGKYFIG